ncbi:hypothetical protein H8356DRAFT_997370 [Neocallimastix lanati (nom. inval.)]|jgi:hypothetical protein|uniref:PX domain-containing protein n=1 Tax=Neocallimastix californiae TaxID=1754190 RepID=A0A1Y2F3F3_9FUNG|nr:hypothetical protein H8356DRAFT_997370 [Neocallimastix sp. JGI-2020a]ORY77485.1 hypothetical protein LY90DRAFT_665267 [Neocallimastix californiae]|eukprot:ORY77485.1 hypothetical protein LY90DRAFT_665267 [Neocallimastix californiae]
MSDNKKKSSELSSFLDILSPLRKSTSSINDITQTDTTKTTNDIKKNNEFYDMIYYKVTVNEQQKKNLDSLLSTQSFYKLQILTNNPNLPKNEYIIERKIKDFQILYQILLENNPGIFIHPVIEKYSFNTTHEELVKNRQNSLNKFLSQITTHPVLKKDPVIEKFFSDNKFNEKEPDSNKKFKLFRNLSNNAFLKGSENNEKILNQKLKIELLSNQLKTLIKVLETLIKNRKDYISTYDDVIQTFSNFEKSKEDNSINFNIKNIRIVMEKIKKNEKKYQKQDINDLLIISDEYIQKLDSIKNCFNARTRLYNTWMDTSQEYKAKLESLNRTKNLWIFEKESLKSKKIEFDELNQKLKNQENDFNEITDTIQKELQEFEKMRIEEFLDAIQYWLEILLEKENKKIKIYEQYFNEENQKTIQEKN